MLKHILATTALATLLATGPHAQTTTGTARDAAEGEAAPLVQDEGGAGTGVEGGASAVVGGAANAQDATVMPDPATTAQDGVALPMDGAAPGQAAGGATGPGVANEGTDPVPPGGGATDSAEDAGTAGEGGTEAAETADPVVTEGAGAGAAETVETTTAPTQTEGATTGATEGALAQEGWSPVELGAVSTERLVGQNIVTNDDETIATIEEVFLDDAGQVGSLVARFGGFLGFGSNRVELQPDEIEIMSNEGDELLVRTGLTPESIEGRPEYQGSSE